MTLIRGATAGAVGSVALNAVTKADVALTGRGASNAPARLVSTAAHRAGANLRTGGGRSEIYGALAGAVTGLGVGVLAGAARRRGVRLPLPVEAAAVGAAAMVASDAPMHALGVTDVRRWQGRDWARDVVPHLAYGLTVSGTLRAFEPAPVHPKVTITRPRYWRSRLSVLTRGFAVGVAAGCRSTMGLVPLAVVADRRAAALGVSGALVATELTADKLPTIPARIEPGPAGARVTLGAFGAGTVARAHDQGVVLPAVLGAAGAVVGTVGGFVGRGMATDAGITWPAAVIEDAVAVALAVWATRA